MASRHRVLRGSITDGSLFSRSSPSRRINQLMPSEARRRRSEERACARRWSQQYAQFTPDLLQPDNGLVDPRGGIGYKIVQTNPGRVDLYSPSESSWGAAAKQTLSRLRDVLGRSGY